MPAYTVIDIQISGISLKVLCTGSRLKLCSSVYRKVGEIAANGHSFAFGRAFGKRLARNCSRLKILKLKIYSVAHLCSVSRICS